MWGGREGVTWESGKILSSSPPRRPSSETLSPFVHREGLQSRAGGCLGRGRHGLVEAVVRKVSSEQ